MDSSNLQFTCPLLLVLPPTFFGVVASSDWLVAFLLTGVLTGDLVGEDAALVDAVSSSAVSPDRNHMISTLIRDSNHMISTLIRDSNHMISTLIRDRNHMISCMWQESHVISTDM